MFYTTTKFPNLFEELFGDQTIVNSVMGPSSKTTTTDESHQIKIAVPGLTKDQLSVSFDKGQNHLEVSYDGEATEFVDKFSKSWAVSMKIDADGIKADVENGILTITLPRKKDQSKVKIM